MIRKLFGWHRRPMPKAIVRWNHDQRAWDLVRESDGYLVHSGPNILNVQRFGEDAGYDLWCESAN
jgi:hypothetical protein